MPEVTRLTPQDWSALRAVRLAALVDSPHAFASTLARETAFTEADWRSWPSRHAVFAALVDGTPVGLAAGAPDPAGLELVSLWLAPGHRGGGLADGLVAAVVGRAGELGVDTVTAWVWEHNARAHRFYDRLGFAPTGRGEPNPAHRDQLEVELALPVPGPAR
ncbi:acetyltransferase [Actinokineospora spheciospongiae]|uniref:Acetyltransferase n=1 Tax=Actinokineospora spheciospongiae TaxID=909613 RepID=W7IWP0_9PSEU|nr:GNAT family N-acetyltransferase [Actinokineospora spheciospongiae]EWC61237.1 acetyltransferase [Actinokineospora spheciospongiae]PWW65386.1 ribosomal protein S18 acetylase RimI-like enzyme [Actinokineospora spheciospongiae]